MIRIALGVFLFGLPLSFAAPARLDLRVKVSLGEDRGQSLGTFVELHDANGEAVAGVGIPEIYATFVRQNPRAIQFFSATDRSGTWEDLGKPCKERQSVSLQMIGNDLVDFDCNKKWKDGRWKPAANVLAGARYTQPVKNKLLVFSRTTITYDGRVIWQVDAMMRRPSAFFYLNERIIAAGNGKLFQCPWKPGPTDIVDTKQCKLHELATANEWIYALTPWEGHLLAATNQGRLYRVTPTSLDLLIKQRGQFYSTIQYHDKILLGHYPSGNLYSWQAGKAERWEHPVLGRIPGKPEITPWQEREAQSATFYAGELWLGVWPWGEVWRVREGMAPRMAVEKRLFTGPPITKEEGPFRDQRRAELALIPLSVEMERNEDQWGQRTKHLLTWQGNIIAAGTGRTSEIIPVPDYMTSWYPQYGRVYKMALPYNASAEMRWSENTQFRFLIEGKRLTVSQDGRVLFRERYDAAPEFLKKVVGMHVGNGQYGLFGGKAIEAHCVAGPCAPARTRTP